MEIKEILDSLICYYDRTRGVGHTHTIINGVLPNERSDHQRIAPFFVGPTFDTARVLLRSCGAQENTAIPISLCMMKRLLGDRRPLVFDNGALYVLFQTLRKYIDKQDEKIKKQEEDITSLTEAYTNIVTTLEKLRTSCAAALETSQKTIEKAERERNKL